MLLVLVSLLSLPCSNPCPVLEPRKGPLKIISASTRVFAPFVTNMKYFSEIHISPTMVLDHLPDRYVDQLNGLIEDWTLERE